MDDFIVLVFGGDIKGEDVPHIIKQVEMMDLNVLIVPFRFSAEYVKKFVTSPKLIVLDGYIELPDIMNASSGLIYGAGMGLTIEAGVLSIPSIKIEGFHRKHASVDLADELGIKVTKIDEISTAINDLKAPKSNNLVENADKAVKNVVKIVNNFDELKGSSSGIRSFQSIWNARSEFK